MAIAPPSDIVLDVANAVGRSGLEAARAELRASIASKSAARISGEAFAAGAPSPTPAPPTPRAEQRRVDDPLVKFEAMVLQTFVQSMLPEGADSVYGEGLSGDMWKSLMAQQLGEAIAQRGGIGIANRLLADHYRQGDAIIPVAGVSPDAARAVNDEKSVVSGALVQKMQQELLQTIASGSVVATGVTVSGEEQ